MNDILTVQSLHDTMTHGYVALNANDDGNCEGIIYYELSDTDRKTIIIKEVKYLPNKKDSLEKMIKCALNDIYESGYSVDSDCKEIVEYFEKCKMLQNTDMQKRYIAQIEPFHDDGNIRFFDERAYHFIEYPIRNAVMELNEKGIKTIMSSANIDDIEHRHEKETNYVGPSQHFSIGNGYAWIMIAYDSLCTENQEILNALNSGVEHIELSEQAQKCLNYNCMVNGVVPNQSELCKFYRVVDIKFKGDIESPPPPTRFPFRSRVNSYSSSNNDYFREHHSVLYQANSLSYNGIDYSVAVIRYPIDENTTIEEVQTYFGQICEKLKENKKTRIL